MSVAHEGFRPQKSKPFELRVQDRVEVNFQLEVGAATTEISVSAAAPLLESETSSLGHVVEERTVNDLPLNGRNFIQLATLGAGTLPSTRTAERDNFISNGARAVQNSYLLDGVDNKNRIMGFDKSSAQIVQPIIDAIQEFKVQTSTFSAEFGQAAGGVVNVTMKAGTNNLHGNLFEFLRNSRMDATPYFQPAGDKKPGFIQNQFGATLGGPVIRNRTFFFGSWQSSREVNAAPQVGSVPTAAMRQGVFSKALRDPLTKANFPNNTIPLNRWDPVAAKLAPLYPLPNLPGEVRNFFYNPKERVSGDAFNLRMDHRLTSRGYLFGRFSQNSGENRLPTVLPEPANQQGYTKPTGRSWMLSETHTLSPTTVNELRFGFIYTHIQQDVLSERLFDQYGIKGALNEPKIKGLPLFNINGLSGLGTQAPGNAPIQATGSGNFPSEKSGKILQLLDNLSWVRSRHTVKFGADLSRIAMGVYATNSARPPIAFNGTYTGIGLGDFLLGYVQNTNTSQQQLNTIRQDVYHGYAQDDWKATSRLTLNFGLRYEVTTPFTEASDRQSNFVLDQGPCYLQIITVADRGKCGIPRALVRTDLNNLAPRIGLAYQAGDKTVVRSGFGVFYGRDEDIGITRRLPNNPPFVTSATFTGDQTNPAYLLQNGIPISWMTVGGGFTDVNTFPFDMRTPYVVQWNLNLQRELHGGLVAQAGYTGSEAHKLPAVVNVNQAYPGTGNVNARRPYQGFSNIQAYSPVVNSNYHALLGKLERRFSRGLSMLASYTYGHSIDDGRSGNDQSDPNPQDARNLAAQRGSSNFDVRHRFVLSGVYQLTFGKSPGAVNALLRDWQISGIYSRQTGQPFTVTLNVDPTATGTAARPNRLRDGALPSDQCNVNRWFDTTAFVAPSCPCFGNSGRGILASPGFVNVDVSAVREFHFSERIRLQFRWEAFNLFNHPNLGLPASAIGAPSVGIIGSVVNNERQIQLAMKLYF
ncbi:MAG: TonB-dependent receptor [Bryobacterales bacterium]|nr:TonB-dependent receptor [Bryobacterales bacterium]